MLLQYWVREPEARGGCIPFRTGVLHPIFKKRLPSERFEGLADPKLVHLFLQAEVVTEIPDELLRGVVFSELDLSGVSGVTCVGYNFLQYCPSLHTADLSGWNNVTRVGHSFLSICSTLRSLDLSGWNTVTHVGDFFLCNCTSLTTLDISGWNNVTHVGTCFLTKCTSLQTLDLSGLTTVQHIGTGFLYGCKIRTSSINVTGSSSVVSEYVQSRNLVDKIKHQCVCM